MAVPDRIRTALKILLLTLVLAVQAFGHAHAVEHWDGDENTFCSICSVTGHNDAIESDTCETTETAPLRPIIPGCHNPDVLQACNHLPEARAPPLS